MHYTTALQMADWAGLEYAGFCYTLSMSVKKNIKLLTWFNFFTDFRLYAAIAAIYFTKVSGSYALGMSIFSIATISSALFELPTGVFSDRIGRRKTVIYGAVGAILAGFFYAIGGSYWMLAIAAVFDGLASAFYSGNNDALLFNTLLEASGEHEYEEYLGKTSASSQAALGIAAVVGGFLASWSFPLIMWLSVIPQVICLFLAFRLIEPKIVTQKTGNIFLHLKEAYTKFLSNKNLRLLSISSILGYGFGEASYQFQAAFFATLWPVWAVGLARTFSNVVATISFHYAGRIIKRFGALQEIMVDNIYNRIVNSIATLFPSVLSPLLMSSTSIFYGATTVGKNSLLQKEFSDEQRATMGSLNSFAGSIFFGVFALILGLTADKLSPAHALFFLQIVQLANLWVYWKLFRKNRKK